MFSELNLVQGSAANRYLSPSLPFCFTLQRWTSAAGRLIPTLQNSISGVWQTLTQAGFPPASLQDIASPHVHCLVRRLCEHQSMRVVAGRHHDTPHDRCRQSTTPCAKPPVLFESQRTASLSSNTARTNVRARQHCHRLTCCRTSTASHRQRRRLDRSRRSSSPWSSLPTILVRCQTLGSHRCH